MSFNDFIYKYKLKNGATSNIKIQQVVASIGLHTVGICLRDGQFEFDIAIVTLHPYKGNHWVCYIHQNYFDSYVCVCAGRLSKFFLKRHRHCLNSEYKIQGQTQKKDSYFASYCLYIIYLTIVAGTYFKSAVLILYYRRIKKG